MPFSVKKGEETSDGLADCHQAAATTAEPSARAQGKKRQLEVKAEEEDHSDSAETPEPSTQHDNNHHYSPKQIATGPAPVTPEGSPSKRPKRLGHGPASPISEEEQKAKEQLARNREVRKEWCSSHVWVKDPNYMQLNIQVRHTSGARKMYNLQIPELATLPHVSFPNKHNASMPGRSYSEQDLLQLLYRKHAILRGLEGLPESELLSQGRDLFLESQRKREETRPNIKTAKIFIVRPRKQWYHPRSNVNRAA